MIEPNPMPARTIITGSLNLERLFDYVVSTPAKLQYRSRTTRFDVTSLNAAMLAARRVALELKSIPVLKSPAAVINPGRGDGATGFGVERISVHACSLVSPGGNPGAGMANGAYGDPSANWFTSLYRGPGFFGHKVWLIDRDPRRLN